MNSFRLASLLQLPLAFLLTWQIASSRAEAQQTVAFQFDGRARTVAIEGVPITFNAPFTGYFSYDRNTPVVDQNGASRTYQDPTGSIVIAFDGVFFHSVGGVTIEISQISNPIFSLNSFRLSANMVSGDGYDAAIQRISIGFVNANDFLPPNGLPDSIDASLITGNATVTSPDLPSGGIEPPRTGLISGSFDNYSRVTPCVIDDLRMQWLFDLAAIVRQLPVSLFFGVDDSEQSLTRSRIALLADTAALGVATCDFAAAGDSLVELAELIADPEVPLVVNRDVATGLLEPVFTVLLSL